MARIEVRKGGMAAALFFALILSACAPVQSTSSLELGERAEVAFSPKEGGEALIVKVLNSARTSIRLAAYSFTSSTVTRSLIAAKKRGVDVAVLVDHKNNLVQDKSGKAAAAMNALVLAGVPVATVSRFPIHHDKYIVVDGMHVETGSYNFSNAAENGNSENVLVLWNSPQVAQAYLQHWKARAQVAVRYTPSF